MSQSLPTTHKDVKALIQGDAFRDRLQDVLPSFLTPQKMMRVALLAINKVPKLAQCSQTSLLGALMDCAALGLEPDGRKAHLIPYGDTATLIVDYKGLVELVMRSGKVSSIHADVVCENDEFEENMGKVTVHKINRREPRGDVFAAYSYVTMKDGTESFEIMSKDDIDRVRAGSKAGKSGPWVDHYSEMAKKTVFRRHCKWLPLEAEYQEHFQRDFDTPKPIMDIEPLEVPDPKDGKAVTIPVEAAESSVAQKRGRGRPKSAEKAVEPPDAGADEPEPGSFELQAGDDEIPPY